MRRSCSFTSTVRPHQSSLTLGASAATFSRSKKKFSLFFFWPPRLQLFRLDSTISYISKFKNGLHHTLKPNQFPDLTCELINRCCLARWHSIYLCLGQTKMLTLKRRYENTTVSDLHFHGNHQGCFGKKTQKLEDLVPMGTKTRSGFYLFRQLGFLFVIRCVSFLL